MRLQRLLPIVLGLRLLVPAEFSCDLTDAKQPAETLRIADHHATANGHSSSHDHHHPATPSSGHDSSEETPARSGHCDSESEEHGCHGDGESCSCGMQSMAIVQPATNLKPQFVKFVAFDAVEGLTIALADEVRTMTRAGPASSHPPRPSPSCTPDCTRAPPTLA